MYVENKDFEKLEHSTSKRTLWRKGCQIVRIFPKQNYSSNWDGNKTETYEAEINDLKQFPTEMSFNIKIVNWRN